MIKVNIKPALKFTVQSCRKVFLTVAFLILGLKKEVKQLLGD